MVREPHVLTAVDLFSGGGGLTVGLKRAGFRVVGAVEIETHAVATYRANHKKVHVFDQDITGVSGSDLTGLSPTGRISLIAGCPPCQGFSSLTSKYRRSDPRNELIRQMARLVAEIGPDAVMVENVPGLSRKGKALFDEFLGKLDKLGYVPNYDVLQVANYGVPQNRRRLVLLAGKGFKIELPSPTHSRCGDGGLPAWKTLRGAIWGMPAPITLSQSRDMGGPQAANWHVVRDITAPNAERLKHAKPGKHWKTMPEDVRPPCHKNVETGYSNVYGRMDWDQVPVTMTGGCTTLSKGRFGHPEEMRTVSVREAARIQTFPDSYVIATPYMDYACQIVGNALPCDFAERVARQCYAALQEAADA